MLETTEMLLDRNISNPVLKTNLCGRMRREINLRFKFLMSKCENSKSIISLSPPSMNLTPVPAYNLITLQLGQPFLT